LTEPDVGILVVEAIPKLATAMSEIIDCHHALLQKLVPFLIKIT
jgi:hypothetical protein